MHFVETLQHALSWLGWYIVPFVVMLSVIVFVHEFGHYIVGRWCGVKIDAFSIGFGPELLARVDSHGTRWRLAAFPIGGYVRFYGDADAASLSEAAGTTDRRLTLSGQPIRNRAAIVAAGPIANFLLAIAIFSGYFAVFGERVLVPRVGGVVANSPAEKAGFKAGDMIVSIDGKHVGSFEDVRRAAVMNTGIVLNWKVLRGGDELSLAAAPELTAIDQGPFGKPRIGAVGIRPSSDPADNRVEACSPVQCLGWGIGETWFVVKGTASYVGGLISARESVDQLSGPIGMARIVGEVAKISLLELLNLAGLFSVSIGLMNLLPIPMLDGGHLLFYAIEGARGRPLSARATENGLKIGLALVGLLVLFTTTHDIMSWATHGN